MSSDRLREKLFSAQKRRRSQSKFTVTSSSSASTSFQPTGGDASHSNESVASSPGKLDTGDATHKPGEEEEVVDETASKGTDSADTIYSSDETHESSSTPFSPDDSSYSHDPSSNAGSPEQHHQERSGVREESNVQPHHQLIFPSIEVAVIQPLRREFGIRILNAQKETLTVLESMLQSESQNSDSTVDGDIQFVNTLKDAVLDDLKLLESGADSVRIYDPWKFYIYIERHRHLLLDNSIDNPLPQPQLHGSGAVIRQRQPCVMHNAQPSQHGRPSNPSYMFQAGPMKQRFVAHAMSSSGFPTPSTSSAPQGVSRRHHPASSAAVGVHECSVQDAAYQQRSEELMQIMTQFINFTQPNYPQGDSPCQQRSQLQRQQQLISGQRPHYGHAFPQYVPRQQCGPQQLLPVEPSRPICFPPAAQTNSTVATGPGQAFSMNTHPPRTHLHQGSRRNAGQDYPNRTFPNQQSVSGGNFAQVGQENVTQQFFQGTWQQRFPLLHGAPPWPHGHAFMQVEQSSFGQPPPQYSQLCHPHPASLHQQAMPGQSFDLSQQPTYQHHFPQILQPMNLLPTSGGQDVMQWLQSHMPGQSHLQPHPQPFVESYPLPAQQPFRIQQGSQQQPPVSVQQSEQSQMLQFNSVQWQLSNQGQQIPGENPQNYAKIEAVAQSTTAQGQQSGQSQMLQFNPVQWHLSNQGQQIPGENPQNYAQMEAATQSTTAQGLPIRSGETGPPNQRKTNFPKTATRGTGSGKRMGEKP